MSKNNFVILLGKEFFVLFQLSARILFIYIEFISIKLSKITPKVTRKTIGGIYELSRSYWQV